MDIVFVMLHYMAIEETKISIDYIRKNVDTEKYKIIVVDNASPDNSGDMLIKEYGQDIDIKIIKARTNLGFARGNNLGFRYAKKCWNPKYIVLMNNDVYLIEKKLMHKLEMEYSKSRFDVLGPMIMTGDGRCDINPQKSEFKNVEDVKKRIEFYKKDLRRYELGYAEILYKIVRIKNIIFSKNTRRNIKKDFINRAEDVKLHGCFLVFSNNYIKEYDGLDESTFLYWEEELLYKHMQYDRKKMVYTPEIKVYHLEDASTNACIKKARKKMIFIRTEYIKSLTALMEIYEKCDKSKER